MKIYNTLLLVSLVFTINAQTLYPPEIYSEIQDTGYSFNELGFTYTTRDFMPIFGMTQIHSSTYGAIRIDNGTDIFTGILNPVDTLEQTPSSAQAFQRFNDGTYSMWSIGEDQVGYFLYDSSMNPTLNLFDIDVAPDNHGITKLSDGRLLGFSSVFEFMNFYNPPLILNDITYLTVGHDIKIVDLQDTSIVSLFNWFDKIPSTMVIPEYLYEGPLGPNVIDWGHPNWISEDYDGNILVSWRHLGLMKISIETGDVIWWAGLPEGLASSNGFPELTALSGDCRTRLQHCFNPISGMDGHYTVFDNGDMIRDSSRALFLKVNEEDMTAEVTAQYWFEPSPFMGSLDLMDNGDFLVNVPTLGNLNLDSLRAWIARGVVEDSIGSYLPEAGSNLYLLKQDGSLVARYWTDSLVYIYSAQMVDYSEWPTLACNGNRVTISEPVTSPIWSTGDTEPDIFADGETVSVSFDFGVTTGYSQIFDSGTCLHTAVSTNSIKPPLIFPNPATNAIWIENYMGYVAIRNVNGQKVISTYTTDGHVNVENLSNGIYFISGRSFTSSFVKQ